MQLAQVGAQRLHQRGVRVHVQQQTQTHGLGYGQHEVVQGLLQEHTRLWGVFTLATEESFGSVLVIVGVGEPRHDGRHQQ